MSSHERLGDLRFLRRLRGRLFREDVLPRHVRRKEPPLASSEAGREDTGCGKRILQGHSGIPGDGLRGRSDGSFRGDEEDSIGASGDRCPSVRIPGHGLRRGVRRGLGIGKPPPSASGRASRSLGRGPSGAQVRRRVLLFVQGGVFRRDPRRQVVHGYGRDASPQSSRLLRIPSRGCQDGYGSRRDPVGFGGIHPSTI